MPEPIIFISRNKVREGKLEDLRNYYRESIQITQAAKPGTLVQLTYENEDATEVTVVRLFPDADALDLQLQGADERSKRTYEFIQPLSVEIFGTPNPYAMEMFKKVAGSGIPVSVNPTFTGGFIRSLQEK